MKQLAVTFFLLGTLLVSCKKENNIIQQTHNLEKIKNDLAVINAKYKPEYNSTAWSLRRLCAIFSADVGGAWAGSWAGGKIGGAVGSLIPGAGTASGAAAGAVAGAVIVGAAASYAASYTIPFETPEMYGRLTNADIGLTLNNPEDNPYDEIVGERHNALLKENLLINKGNTEKTISELYNSCNLLDNEKIFLAEGENISQEIYTIFRNEGSAEKLKEILASKIDNELILTIANSFIDGAYSTNNATEAISLTQEYEKYVNDLKDIKPLEKQTLFSGFSVAKYSSNFWKQIISE